MQNFIMMEFAALECGFTIPLHQAEPVPERSCHAGLKVNSDELILNQSLGYTGDVYWGGTGKTVRPSAP